MILKKCLITYYPCPCWGWRWWKWRWCWQCWSWFLLRSQSVLRYQTLSDHHFGTLYCWAQNTKVYLSSKILSLQVLPQSHHQNTLSLGSPSLSSNFLSIALPSWSIQSLWSSYHHNDPHIIMTIITWPGPHACSLCLPRDPRKTSIPTNSLQVRESKNVFFYRVYRVSQNKVTNRKKSLPKLRAVGPNFPMEMTCEWSA